MNDDGSIDLSFGEDSGIKEQSFEPAPEGVYNLMAGEIQVTQTKKKDVTSKSGNQWHNPGEHMVTIVWSIEDSDGYDGKQIRERMVIPGSERQAHDWDSWNAMMNMLRDRLEAITGETWRDDNMKLNPQRDLSGRLVKALVIQKPYSYTDTTSGELKSGVGNEVKKYLEPIKSSAGSGGGFQI